MAHHVESIQHQRNTKTVKLGYPETKLQAHIKDKVTRAEVKVANLLIQHNVPVAVADHLSPLVRDIFSNSETAQD